VERKKSFLLGDLVYYVGPPVLHPLKWELIVINNNGIINKEDVGIIVKCDSFLNIADVFFQKSKITINRISYRQLKIITD